MKTEPNTLSQLLVLVVVLLLLFEKIEHLIVALHKNMNEQATTVNITILQCLDIIFTEHMKFHSEHFQSNPWSFTGQH